VIWDAPCGLMHRACQGQRLRARCSWWPHRACWVLLHKVCTAGGWVRACAIVHPLSSSAQPACHACCHAAWAAWAPTECLPRRNTKELGSPFLAGSGVSTTCVRFFLCKCRAESHQRQATAKTLVTPNGGRRSRLCCYATQAMHIVITLRVFAMANDGSRGYCSLNLWV
jgi:hypothetical protein